jgi:retrograde regulation protein 2
MADNMGEVITLDNFASEISRLGAGDGKPLYAVVDMGSNGIRFSISELEPDRCRILPCLYRERAGISLYDALHESTGDSKPFHFSHATIKAVAGKLARFKSICDSYGVQKSRIIVFATEAMRSAVNKDDIMKAIKDASGLEVDILSPQMESLFGAMGARSPFGDVNGLFMDLGGGSVQMTYVPSGSDVASEAARAGTSLPFGAAKVTAASSATDAANATVAELNAGMKEAFDGLMKKFPELVEQATNNDGITIYFCGGGFRGYGSMLMHTDPIQPYPIPAIGGYTVPGHRFSQWQKMLEANSKDGKIFGMSKRRREQFPAIVTVVKALIGAVPNIKQVIFCSGGNREGVLYMVLPPAVRERSPLAHLGEAAGPFHDEVTNRVVDILFSALPKGYPEIFTRDILQCFGKLLWTDMGNTPEVNSARALHDPISYASVLGFTHQVRAVLSLTLCARWGNDLGPVDQILYNNLRALIGPELSWWCDYIGKVLTLLSTVVPTFPATATELDKAIALSASTHGSDTRKVRIKVHVVLEPTLSTGVKIDELEGIFDKVGKGLHLGWKIKTEIKTETGE